MIVLPDVAETVSYTSEVIVRNPTATSLTLNVGLTDIDALDAALERALA